MDMSVTAPNSEIVRRGGLTLGRSMRSVLIGLALSLWCFGSSALAEEPRTSAAIILVSSPNVTELQSSALLDAFAGSLGAGGRWDLRAVHEFRDGPLTGAETLESGFATQVVMAVAVSASASVVFVGRVSAPEGRFMLSGRLIDVWESRDLVKVTLEAPTFDELVEESRNLAGGLASREEHGPEVSLRTPRARELLVHTEPGGADVYVNGTHVGVSPVLVKVLTENRILVESWKGSLFGFEQVELEEKSSIVRVVLHHTLGRVFVKTDVPELHVSIDGEPLGALGDGLIRNVPSGERVLELSGDGLLWTGTVEVRPEETSEVTPELRPYGSLAYEIPYGALAEVSGDELATVLVGTGLLSPVPTGGYVVTVRGPAYERQTLRVSLNRGETVGLRPELRFTEAYERLLYGGELQEIRALLDAGSQVDSELTRRFERVRAAIQRSVHDLTDLGQQTEPLALRVAEGMRLNAVSERVAELERQRQQVLTNMEDVASRQRARLVVSWSAAGFGVLSGAISGLFAVLTDQAYQRYMATSVQAEAVRYREEFQLYDSLTIGFGGAGVLGFGAALVTWLTRPVGLELRMELLSVEAELRGMEAHGK